MASKSDIAILKTFILQIEQQLCDLGRLRELIDATGAHRAADPRRSMARARQDDRSSETRLQ
jgi:hypothetical protein